MGAESKAKTPGKIGTFLQRSVKIAHTPTAISKQKWSVKTPHNNNNNSNDNNNDDNNNNNNNNNNNDNNNATARRALPHPEQPAYTRKVQSTARPLYNANICSLP